ncbi:MAG: aminotransferase class I/II-fold pyridoxal phosphate-dependent enzyme [Pseudomonadales bacterium]|nr:aminotransferase class I/II-fold pyridoxal phosphate-dependent enzyme [Pseudomonadales bacterium]NIX09863.1 aminotransferase class I/II-fold pyridoxal phosphate-dependent enzyme [Pseudomonadales bacterium]
MAELSDAELEGLQADLSRELELQAANRLSLDLTRGKPAPDQLELSAGLDDAIAGNYIASDGTDSRNYGALTGLREARELGAEIMEADPEDIICWGNSSLQLMHTCVDLALNHGLWGDGRRWSRDANPKVLTPVPGYDRHFTICEAAGIEMINVPMTDTGPDMDAARRAVEDPSVKGIWCVPKYSNPSGCIYSPERVEELARLPADAAADDFVILWDNAYAVHDFEFPRAPLASLLDLARRHGTGEHVIMFASTSKITYPSAGLAFLAADAAVRKAVESRLGTASIGPDKVNQLRHARFLGGRVEAHMAGHAALVKPKFELVERKLREGLAGLGIADWTTPAGGYFVSLDTRPGLAKDVGDLAAKAGLTITKPGATFPYGRDPEDANLRIAPTFASLADLAVAMDVLVVCVKLAAISREIDHRSGTAGA